MNKIVKCKHCGNYEYYGEFRWSDGRCMCRDCYKAAYETTYGKIYEWDDLDGARPTEREIFLEGFDYAT